MDGRWVLSAPRPYDPPLTEKGEKQAEGVAKKFKDKVFFTNDWCIIKLIRKTFN